MNVFFSTALLCALMIAVSDSKAIGSRQQTNTIPSKAGTLNQSQRPSANSNDDFVVSGTSDFAYMGEIAIPNSISGGWWVFDNTKEQITNPPTSTTTTSTTTPSTTERPRAGEPNACQLKCHTRITNEYNPLCGSDGISYFNPGKLECAKRCGKKIIKFRHGSCGPGHQLI